MDNKLTENIKSWLDTPSSQRDLQHGALLMLKLNHNRILYQNATRRPDKFADKIEYELSKFLKIRLNTVTKEQVVKLEQYVKQHVTPTIEKATATGEEPQFEGKRQDHELLPDHIKAIYVEQATILKQMRDLHAKLRLKSTPEYKPCDRYQDLDTLVSLSKKYLSNWETYDHFNVNEQTGTITPVVKKSSRKTKKATCQKN